MTIPGQKGKQNTKSGTTLMSLTLEYESLFEHQGFLMQGLHGMYIFVALELRKESDLLLDPPAPPD